VQQAAEMMAKARVRRDCCSRNGGEFKTHRRDHRSRYRLACSGYGQKPGANEPARCHGEPPVTITREAFRA